MKKKQITIGAFILIICVILLIFWRTGMANRICLFMKEYSIYLSEDSGHKADLVECIFSGICSGVVTFIALYITIKHENNQRKREQINERKREHEKLLLSVRPVLNISIKNLSKIRATMELAGSESIVVGSGEFYQYANVVLSNDGYGKCVNIKLNEDRFCVRELNVDEEREVKIYFIGLEADHGCQNQNVEFCYNDIFGDQYKHKFCFSWSDNGNTLEVYSVKLKLEKDIDE